MPAAIDITGERYGRLVAIRPDTSTGKRLWLFKCDCGTERLMPAGRIRSGVTSSCGCLRRETTAKSRRRDLLGKSFGRLTVTRKLAERTAHGCVQWECKCECGSVTKATTNSLNRKSKQSCGCLRRELISALGASSKKQNPVSQTPEYRSELRKRRRSRPEVAMAERVSRMLCWALADVGAVKRGKTFDMLGYTPAELKDHIEKQFLPGMSWDNRSEWEIDHITPISSATCEQDVIELNQLYNLRPLWSAANNAKKDKRLYLI